MRFERHGPGARFVELVRQRAEITHTFGPLDAPGKSRAERHPSDSAADEALRFQIRRLQRKGYLPGRFHPEMVRRIQEDPSSPGPFLVYGDWLLERGDPRGALIGAMASGDGEEAERLMRAHPVLLRPAWWTWTFAALDWRLGFLERVTLSTNPGRLWWSAPRELYGLLGHPSAQALEEIVIRLIPGTRGPQDDGVWIHELGYWLRRRPPTLARLVVRGAWRPARHIEQVEGVAVLWEK